MIDNIKNWFTENWFDIEWAGIWLLFAAFGIGGLYLILRYWANKNKQTELARIDYLKAIRSGDKLKALNEGRRYYSLLRGGNLTIYDEQAITNDLSTMKEKESYRY